MPDDPKPPAKTGRPRKDAPKFLPQFVEIARQMCDLGATDHELARAFNVPPRTVRRWRHMHPAFAEACVLGKDHANTRVERSLYERAVGFERISHKIVVVNKRVRKVRILEYYPPETVAGIFFLKNRRPDIWRDKLGEDTPTKPIDVSANPLPPEDWVRKHGNGSSRPN